MKPFFDELKRLDDETLAGRQRQLQRLAWGATLLPIAVVLGLGWFATQQLAHKQRELADVGKLLADNERAAARLTGEIQELERTRAALNQDLAEQRLNTAHYRAFAGMRIQYYRPGDRQIIERALSRYQFKIELKQGNAQVISLEPNTIAHGSDVSSQDLEDIACALVEAGFPLKRVVPATRIREARLVQVFASARTDRDCGPLSVDHVRAGLTCGPRAP